MAGSLWWGHGLRAGAVVVSAMACMAGPAAAQADATPAVPQQVEVRGRSASHARSDAVGALVVVPREELLRHADTRLADALQRVPGVTVVQGGPRGSEIRMAGLGGGYTQLLLNGEPVPPGFALDTLSPDSVERVEISRSASVEHSGQAIAGSINIVLRRAPSQAQRELKLGLGMLLGWPTGSADVQWGDRQGAWHWGLGVGLAADRQRWPMALEQQVLDRRSGALTQSYSTDKQERDRTERLTLSPRASWAPSPGLSLGTDHLWRVFRSSGAALDRRTSQSGALPPLARNDLFIHSHGHSLRSRANGALTLDDGSKWELKLGVTQQRRNSRADFDGWDFADTWVRDAQVDSLAVDSGWNLAGRWRAPGTAAHGWALGWDAEQTRRSEDRLQREQPLPGGWPVENLDEVYDARVQRLAAFAQDEWALGAGWTATLGLRWESLHTRSRGNVFEAVSARSSVWGPVLQTVWRVPGSRDEWRLGLARTYKAPTPRELMPRRYVANNNSPTTPDLQGNASLRPELAWGLDAGWQRPMGVGDGGGGGGLLALTAYFKHVQQVIVDELLQQNGSWVLRRANLGTALVWGAEAEARAPLRTLWPAAPALDLRATLALNRSRVAAVPGPHNRLAQQTPLSLTLGLDHKVSSLPLSWGASYGLQQGAPQRLSATRFADKADTHRLDAYAVWKLDTRTQWRVALSNLLQRDLLDHRRVLDGDNEHRVAERWQTGAALRLTLEAAL